MQVFTSLIKDTLPGMPFSHGSLKGQRSSYLSKRTYSETLSLVLSLSGVSLEVITRIGPSAAIFILWGLRYIFYYLKKRIDVNFLICLEVVPGMMVDIFTLLWPGRKWFLDSICGAVTEPPVM